MATNYKELAYQGLPSITRNDRWFKELGVKVENLEYQSGDAGRKHIEEMQAELHACRMEQRRKEECIQGLLKERGLGPLGGTTPGRISLDTRTLVTGISSSNTQELAALQIKVQNLEDKLRRDQAESAAREEQLARTKAEHEGSLAEVARLSILVKELQTQVEGSEDFKAVHESLKARNEFAVTHLQEQYAAAQTRIMELEARIRDHLDSREAKEVDVISNQTKLLHLMSDASRLLEIEHGELTEPIVTKLTEVVQERHMLTSQVESLKASVESKDGEIAACKETITRLMGDVGKETVGYTSYSKSRVSYKAEAERMAAMKDDLELQVCLLDKRVEAANRVTQSLRQDLADTSLRMQEMETSLKDQTYTADAATKQFNALVESIAVTIGSADNPCVPTEGEVKERIKTMAREVKEFTATNAALEERFSAMQRQFEAQYGASHKSNDRMRQLQMERDEMEERIKMMENEMGARDVMFEGQRADKDRICRQLHRIADSLRLDYIPEDTDIDYLISIIQKRVSQIPSAPCLPLPVPRNTSKTSHMAPTAASTNRCATVHQQEHQLAALRDQVAAKEHQIEVLRRENAGLLKRAAGNCNNNTCCAKEPATCHHHHHNHRRDAACSPTPRCHLAETPRDRVDRLHFQLEASRDEIAALKEALVASQESMLASETQDQEIQDLSKNLEKMEKIRQRQARKIATLKQEMEDHTGRKTISPEEMHKIKSAYTELAKRERHGAEFRETLAGLLAVDVMMEPNPDAEMLSRVMRMLRACQQSGIVLPTGPIGPPAGHSRALPAPTKPDVIPSSSMRRSSKPSSRPHSRARSSSPRTKKDTNKY